MAIQRNTEGFFIFTNRNSGKHIDVRGANTDEGGEIIQYAPNSSTSQQWRIATATCPVASGRWPRPPLAQNRQPTFRLWPNPAQDQVLIDLQAFAGQPVVLTLTDLAGQPVFQQQLDDAPSAPYRLPLAAYPSGLYLLRANATTQPAQTSRLLIQH